MQTFIHFATSCVSAFCSIAMLLMIVRAILSWFPGQGHCYFTPLMYFDIVEGDLPIFLAISSNV